MSADPGVTPDDIATAYARLRGQVRRTPLERAPELARLLGGEVWLKCECWQETGSFKLRGALNALLMLDPEVGGRGVVTASAGNHGLGVAEAASRLGVRATVVVPVNASAAKVRALRGYASRGIELLPYGATYDEAEAHAIALAAATGQHYLSSYNDPAVIAGNGTVALEALEDAPEASVLVVPAGGAGLISGCGVWAHHARPGVRVIAVQSEASPTLHASFAAGRLVEAPVGPSLADGLAGNIEAGSVTWPLARRVVERVVLVTESEIAEAMRWLLREHHILVEGSAATVVAAVLARRLPDLGGASAILMLTGRNIAEDTLRGVLCDASAAS
jgi:threonine dehydratase